MSLGRYKTNGASTYGNTKLCDGCGHPLPEITPLGKPYHLRYCRKCRDYKLNEFQKDPEIQANKRAMEASIQHRR
jgi:hypothetical protein